MSDPIKDYLAEYGHGPIRDEMEKEAGFGKWYSKQAPITRRVIEGAGMFVAGQLGSMAYEGIRGAVQKSHGFRSMIKHNPSLAKHDRKKVQAIYNTLHNVSPDLAKDPVVSSSWVNRMMYQDEYVDPRTMSDLATAQQRMSQNSGFDPYKFSRVMSDARGAPDLFGGPASEPKSSETTRAGIGSGGSGGGGTVYNIQRANITAGKNWQGNKGRGKGKGKGSK